VAVTTVLGAGALAIGLLNLPVWLAIAVSLTFGVTGSFISLAITEGDNRTRHLSFAVAFALILVAILGGALARTPDDPIELVAVGGESSVWQAVGEPGGESTVGTLISGTTVIVECQVSLDGVIWYRLAWLDPVAWLPQDALRARRGEELPEVPEC
jgi:hypothetical protein